jgi:repressor LexA
MNQTKEEPASGEVLTPRQVQLLSTIAGFRISRGYLPTIGELAQQLSISRTTAFGHIEQLRRKGLLSGQQCPSTKARARSLNLTSKARRRLKQIPDTEHQASSIAQKGSLTGEHLNEGIPLVGRVAAGLPVEAVENKDSLSLESCFGNTGNIFALEVKGDSMIGEDIHEGDYVICKKTATASNGQLVVAIVDNEDATLKRFYRENNLVRLQPANDNYEPIYSDNCRIEGVVIGLVRKL